MDDHVHVLVRPYEGFALEKVVHSWKSFSSHKLRQGPEKHQLWQNESEDRIIRNELELREKMEYILKNPFKRWPDIEEYAWMGMFWGDYSKIGFTRDEAFSILSL